MVCQVTILGLSGQATFKSGSPEISDVDLHGSADDEMSEGVSTGLNQQQEDT